MGITSSVPRATVEESFPFVCGEIVTYLSMIGDVNGVVETKEVAVIMRHATYLKEHTCGDKSDYGSDHGPALGFCPTLSTPRLKERRERYKMLEALGEKQRYHYATKTLFLSPEDLATCHRLQALAAEGEAVRVLFRIHLTRGASVWHVDGPCHAVGKRSFPVFPPQFPERGTNGCTKSSW